MGVEPSSSPYSLRNCGPVRDSCACVLMCQMEIIHLPPRIDVRSGSVNTCQMPKNSAWHRADIYGGLPRWR